MCFERRTSTSQICARLTTLAHTRSKCQRPTTQPTHAVRPSGKITIRLCCPHWRMRRPTTSSLGPSCWPRAAQRQICRISARESVCMCVHSYIVLAHTHAHVESNLNKIPYQLNRRLNPYAYTHSHTNALARRNARMNFPYMLLPIQLSSRIRPKIQAHRHYPQRAGIIIGKICA